MKAFAAAIIFCLTGAAFSQTESKMDVGITGYTGSNLPPHLDPFTVMAEPTVQRLVMLIAETPREPRYVDDALRGGRFNKAQLEELGVIQFRDGMYALGFTYFTKADVDRLMDVSSRYAKKLTTAFKAEWSDFDSILSMYPVKSVAKRDLAFFLLGCVSLDWDGLALTSELGLRVEDKPQAGGGKYLLWASEKGGNAFQGMYWGSHYTEAGKSVLITFGDHYSLPRRAFPDINGKLARGVSSAVDAPDLKEALRNVGVDMSMQLCEWAGETMLALRDSGAMRSKDLAAKMGYPESRADNVLQALKGLGYVEDANGKFSVAVPTLTEADKPMVSATEEFGRRVMRKWLEDNYDAIRQELSELTAVKQGVPYEEVFSQAWHYLFGATNRELAAQGLIRDTYAPDSRFTGFVPVVSAPGVAQRN